MFSFSDRITGNAVLILVFLLTGISVKADDINSHSVDTSKPVHHEEEFNARKFILDHIADSHDWHIFTDKHGHHVSIPLPIILYSENTGLHIFLSFKLAHGHEYKGFRVMEQGDYAGKIVEVNSLGEFTNAPLDFSITKIVAGMLVSVFVMLVLFIRMGMIYKREGVTVPKGINGLIEPMVLFIRDQVALPNIGEKKHEKFVPFLLTIFFFILINNLFGLIPFFPFGANITGNIAVTLSLSLFTLIITNINGTKDYWKHIFATPGIPLWLLPLMIPVEFIGIFTKPFALMIRLFANITAGHIIMLSLIGLIFIFKSLSVAPISFIMVLFMNFLELLVAFLQAYVFTLLSALFIGLAVKEHHH